MGLVDQPRAQPLVLSPQLARWSGLTLGRALVYLTLGIAIVLIGMPMYWMLLAAFKTNKEIFTAPPTWIPLAPTLENFPAAWNQAPFGNFYVNSIIYTVIGGGAKI